LAHGRSLEDISTHLFSAVLSDILDKVGCFGQVAAPVLAPLDPKMRAVGYARTVRAVMVSQVPTHPYEKLLVAIDQLTSSEVLVIGLQPGSSSALFGGLLATAVAAAGGRGVIVDGYTRDANEILEIGLPTFAKGLMPLDSYGRDEVVEIGGPVDIAGVRVSQGDLVFADIDGLVVVPARIEDEVITKAFEKVEGEGEVRQALRGGMSVAEAFARFGIL